MSRSPRPPGATWMRRACGLVGLVGLVALGALVGCGEDDAAAGALPTDPPSTVATSPKARTTATVGSASAGRTVFETTCQICHKLDESEVGAGPRLVGANLTADAIRQQVEHPREAMPPNLVSGKDLDDVIAFILQFQ